MRSAEQEPALQAQNRAATAALALATKRYRSGYSPYLEQLVAPEPGRRLAGGALMCAMEGVAECDAFRLHVTRG
jgi:hypothetical protein